MPNPGFLRFLLQRTSGVALSVLLLVHLGTIMYAVQGGLSVAEIADRLQGNALWQVLYSVFILIAITHAGIGIRNILTEIRVVPVFLTNVAVSVYVVGSTFLGAWTIRTLVLLS